MGQRGPKRLTAAQLRAKGSNPQTIKRREEEEKAQRRLQVVPHRQHAIPPTPRGLKGKARQFFQTIAQAYVLEPHFQVILSDAAWAMQRGEEARKVLTKEGVTFIDQWGNTKQHPAAIVERQSAALFAKLIKQLDLPED